jgi:hypothetical protein
MTMTVQNLALRLDGPTIIHAKTKQELLSKFQQQTGAIWVNAAGSTGYAQLGKHFYGLNMEKRRRKTKIVPGYHKSQVMGHPCPNREVVRESHWIGYLYSIPNFLAIKQNPRNFEIKLNPLKKHSWIVRGWVD